MGRSIVKLIPALALCLLATSAFGASFEEFIMPGPLTADHAEYEPDCDACHSSFGAVSQDKLCLDCHEEIAEDMGALNRFHGRSPDVADSECRDCHTDHEGRDHDISGLVPETFNHQHTNFELLGAHASISCVSCHTDQESFRGTSTACFDCHEQDDAHDGGLGSSCENCHSASGWLDTQFDHDTETDFVITGAHLDATCTQCHIDNLFEDTSPQCVDCHSVDDVHQGSRGSECNQCHTTESWQESEFQHLQETGFDLQGAHAELSCQQCHLVDMALTNPPTECIGCHSSDDPHLGDRGSECDSCHSLKTWSLEFDHASETGFALLGRHSELACEHCHTGALTDPISSNCQACHEADDPHEGSLGECNECHNEVGWISRVRFDHEFTSFPLIGMHSAVSCEQCHATHRFDEAEGRCAECHTEDDHHDARFGSSCNQCHTPGGWEIWQFDHNQETDFVLDGSHSDLVCDACHGVNSGPAEYLDTECASCHLADDVHGGQFGRNCGQCHTTQTFRDNAGFR